MFNFEKFKGMLYDAAENAEERDLTEYDIAEMAIDYVRKEMKKKKDYTLVEKDKFIKDVEDDIFKALDEDDEEWFDNNLIIISVGYKAIHLDNNADAWNEVDLALREIYEVEFENRMATTGNTNITSEALIADWLKKRYDETINHGVDFNILYNKIIEISTDEYVMSDVAERIRIENDLRGSEVKVLYDDFENGKLSSIIEKVTKKFLMDKFEECYSTDGDKTFLISYIKKGSGEVVDFVWGSGIDWSDKKKEIINKFWEEICK